MAVHLEIRPLREAFGAEILGFDASRSGDAKTAGIWHEALDRHQLLVFRDVDLGAEAQLALAQTLGSPLLENESGRAWQFVSNSHSEGILGDERFAFHSDHAFMEDPIEVISLYGLEIPTAGTSTRFVNGLIGARTLPPDLLARVTGRRARHIIDPGAESGRVPVRGPRLPDDLPHAWHPILWPGGRSADAILYVNEQQTDRVEGLAEDESRTLIEDLFAHLYREVHTYTHAWRAGDLVLWDNRALQHARDAIPLGASRNLRRISVGGTPVYEYFRRHEKWGLD